MQNWTLKKWSKLAFCLWKWLRYLWFLKICRSFTKNKVGNTAKGYLEHASKRQFLMRMNFRLWKSCTASNFTEGCFDPGLVKKFCKMFPIRMIKTVRLRVKYLEELLEHPILKLKVIILIRDPRGVMRSRSQCGNLRIFLSLRFYVKSTLVLLTFFVKSFNWFHVKS